MPVPFPETGSGVEIELLKQLFTREEAAVALELSAQSETIDKIYRRLDKGRFTKEEVRHHLDALVEKGSIIGFIHDKKGEMVYQKIPLAIGMFEFQVDRINRKISELFFQYHDEAFAGAMISMKTKQMRTIPVNVKIEPYFVVDNYDNARAIVHASPGPYALMNCVCRQARETLDQPCACTDMRETCITLGNSARYMLARGVARELSKKEMLKFLTKAKKEGLVLQPENTRDPSFICCCCGCCCAVLEAAKKYDRPVDFIHANYQAHILTDRCDGCEDCRERCPMDALSRVNSHMAIDHDRCIGCGLCVSVCPQKALRLVKKKQQTIPPEGKDDMYKRMLKERYGLWGTLAFGGRMALGKKV